MSTSGWRVGEQVERHHGELVGPAGRLRTRVEAHARALLGADRGVERVRQIAPEVEVVGGHAVVAPQELGQPAPGRDVVEAEAVRRLGQEPLAPRRIERRLEVLDEVEARPARGRGEDRIRGLPRRGEDRVRVLDAGVEVAHLGLDPRPPRPDDLLVLLERPAVLVLEVDDAAMAGLLERRDEPEHRRVAARAGARRGADPRDRERLAGHDLHRRRQRPAVRGDLRRPLEVGARDGEPAAAGRRDAVRHAVGHACRDARIPLGAQEPPRLADAVHRGRPPHAATAPTWAARQSITWSCSSSVRPANSGSISDSRVAASVCGSSAATPA